MVSRPVILFSLSFDRSLDRLIDWLIFFFSVFRLLNHPDVDLFFRWQQISGANSLDWRAKAPSFAKQRRGSRRILPIHQWIVDAAIWSSKPASLSSLKSFPHRCMWNHFIFSLWKYLASLVCPFSSSERPAVLDWLLRHCVAKDYRDIDCTFRPSHDCDRVMVQRGMEINRMHYFMVNEWAGALFICFVCPSIRLMHWLVDWFSDCLINCSIDWVFDWLNSIIYRGSIIRLIDWLIDWFVQTLNVCIIYVAFEVLFCLGDSSKGTVVEKGHVAVDASAGLNGNGKSD